MELDTAKSPASLPKHITPENAKLPTKWFILGPTKFKVDQSAQGVDIYIGQYSRNLYSQIQGVQQTNTTGLKCTRQQTSFQTTNSMFYNLFTLQWKTLLECAKRRVKR